MNDLLQVATFVVFAFLIILAIRQIVLWYTGVTIIVSKLDTLIAEMKRLNAVPPKQS